MLKCGLEKMAGNGRKQYEGKGKIKNAMHGLL